MKESRESLTYPASYVKSKAEFTQATRTPFPGRGKEGGELGLWSQVSCEEDDQG